MQFTVAVFPHFCPKGSRPGSSLQIFGHSTCKNSQIQNSLAKLSSKSCQTLERYILLGLCCMLEEEISQGQGWPSPGKKCWDSGGSRQLLGDVAKSLTNSISGELFSHNCMILRWFKTSHWHDSMRHILKTISSSTNILSSA